MIKQHKISSRSAAEEQQKSDRKAEKGNRKVAELQKSIRKKHQNAAGRQQKGSIKAIDEQTAAESDSFNIALGKGVPNCPQWGI